MNRQMTKCLARTAGALALTTLFCLSASPAFAQGTANGAKGAASKAAATARVTGIRLAGGKAGAADKLVIDYVGPEPQVTTQTVDGKLRVSLKGLVVPASMARPFSGGASSQVVRSVGVNGSGKATELTVHPKTAGWDFKTTTGSRSVTIEFKVAAAKPTETAAAAAVVPVPVPLPAAVDVPVPIPAPVPVAAAPEPVVATPAPEPVASPAPVAVAAATETTEKAAEAEGEPVLASKTRKLKPCIECHEQFFTLVRSKHFVKGDPNTPKGSDAECTGCHGDTLEHNKKPRAKGLVPVVFGPKAPIGPQNEACMSCHKSNSLILWEGSKHERTQVPCASCHKAHSTKDPVVVAETQAGVCFECHKDRRAEMFRTSVHARKTGFFACSSCHSAHGSPTRALLAKNSVNETCFTCHAGYRGPFLWEHRSAQDDCMNCHSPHGTNSPPMLKARMPYLCLQCHMNSGANNHANFMYSGAQLGSTANPAERMVGRSCANCHAKIHGSNHPSGARLQR